MLSRLMTSGNIDWLRNAARFAEKRQEVLAGNLANVDTPGYRMQDMPVQSFQQALREAVAQTRGQPVPRPTEGLALGQPESLSGMARPSADPFPEELFRPIDPSTQPGITFQDGANRSVESQMLTMSKNALYQNYAMELLRLQYDQLHAAISEQP